MRSDREEEAQIAGCGAVPRIDHESFPVGICSVIEISYGERGRKRKRVIGEIETARERK